MLDKLLKFFPFDCKSLLLWNIKKFINTVKRRVDTLQNCKISVNFIFEVGFAAYLLVYAYQLHFAYHK